MATTPLKYLHQYFTTTLNVGGGLTNSQTTGIVIQAVSGLDIAKPGVACLTYADPINTSTAEWITYTSIDGSNELQGVVRGAEGFGAKTHSNGAVVAFPLSESHINNLNAMFDTTGLDIKQIATPANPDSGRNKIYFKSDDKAYILTSAGVEVEVVSTTSTTTLTNKRITSRVVTTTDDATAVIDVDVTDQYQLTAVANATVFTVTGTPTAGQKLIVRFKDAGVAKGLTWTGFTSKGATLPTTTVAGKEHYVGLIYNATATTWDCVAAVVES